MRACYTDLYNVPCALGLRQGTNSGSQCLTPKSTIDSSNDVLMSGEQAAMKTTGHFTSGTRPGADGTRPVCRAPAPSGSDLTSPPVAAESHAFLCLLGWLIVVSFMDKSPWFTEQF